MLKIVSASHTDHVSPEVLSYLQERFPAVDPGPITVIETVPLPEGLTATSGLYGPTCGDAPVLKGEAYYANRPGREYRSRLVRLPKREVRQVTVIMGRYGKDPCVLYTAFGGPLAPKEPDDPSLQSHERAASVAFWAEHALSDEES